MGTRSIQRAMAARTIRQLRRQLHHERAANALLRDECTSYAIEIDRLRLETFTDPLTGAYNRKGLRHVWEESATTITAVCLLDGDRFKQINDRYGHAVGDVVICHIVECIRGQGAIAARTGGDEFGLLITDGQDDPEVIIRGVLESIARPRSIRGHTITITATVGMCLVDQGHAGPMHQLGAYLDRADAALYEGKRSGRNTSITTKL